MSGLVDTVRREAARALSRAHRAVRRGTLGTPVGSGYTAQVQGLDGETWEGAEVWQQAGLASRPTTGAEVVVVEPDGGAEGAIVVATQDRGVRPSLSDDEVAVYGLGANRGQVTLRADGHVDAEPGGGGKVNIGGDQTTCVDAVLLGTTHDTAWRIFCGAWAGQLTVMAALFAGPNSISAGFTAAQNAFTSLSGEGALTAGAQSACSTAAGACGQAATAAGSISLALGTIGTALSTYLGGSYLAAKAMVR